MTLSAATLADLMAGELRAGPHDAETGLNAAGITAEGSPALDAFCLRIASAVVDHLTASAVVSVDVPGAGLTAGATAVTGTATGTGGVS